MRQPGYISFSLVLVDSLHLRLKGKIDEQANGSYTITNIRRIEQENGSLLPPIQIKKKGDQWVHTDSEKETDLSLAIGQAIEEHLPTPPGGPGIARKPEGETE
jgi:hypothetical protein